MKKFPTFASHFEALKNYWEKAFLKSAVKKPYWAVLP